MKLIFKRSLIGMIVLGMAGAQAMPNNNMAMSPHFNGAFIGIEGLYLRPQNGDLSFATFFPTVAGDSAVHSKSISPSYNWDWRFYGGIRYTDNDDITLSWQRIRASDSSAGTPSSLNDLFGSSFPRWLFPSTAWSYINGHVTFDLDDIYGVWGHTINFNNPWSIRYALGVDYVKLDSDMTVTARFSSGQLSFDRGFTSDNHLKGFGPRAEFDMTYRLPHNFALFGKANAAVFASTRKISLDPIPATTDIVLDDSSVFTTRHVMIPKVGMRLCASYSYVWGQVGAEGISCRTTTLMIDAGWQAETYIHAIERVDSGSLSLAKQSFAGFTDTKVSNFADQGLFLGIELGTDWM